MIAEKSLIPFSSSTGTTMRCVAPIGHSPMATGDWSLSCCRTRIRCASSPTSVAGTVTRRSTSFSLVYGSAGGSRSGASLIGISVALGSGVATSSSTNPPNDEPTAPATRLSPPAPTYSTPTPSATTATASSKRKTTGMRPPRSIG